MRVRGGISEEGEGWMRECADIAADKSRTSHVEGGG